jgi:predicted O-linked N-acetylglucosamine transferase (SPINDLY family)
LLQTAVAHHHAGRFREAEALYRQILSAAPGHFDAKHLLGVIALQNGRLDEAHALIAEAIRLNPKVAAAHNNLGNVQLRRGQFDAAQAAFKRAVELQPGFADAHFNLANQLRRQGRLQDAATHFRRAAAAEGKALAAHLSLGATLLDLGDARGAARAFETAIKHEPDHAEALSYWGIALCKAGDLQQAVDALDRAAKLDPDSPAVLANRGNVLARLGRHAEARQCLERVVALQPNSAAAHCNLGNLLRDAGSPTEALDRFRHAIKLDPGLVEAEIGLGLTLRDLGRDDEARNRAGRLDRNSPAYAAAVVFDATARLEQGDAGGAVKALREALTLQGSNADAHYQLGIALMQQLRSKEAIGCFQRAIAIDGSHVRARWALTMAQVTPLCSDVAEVARSRSTFARMLGELDTWFDPTRTIDGHNAVGSLQPYYLAYHSEENRQLLMRYGALCARLMEPWQAQHVPSPGSRMPNGPVRVGIASAQLRDHSVWNAIVKGWVKHIDKRRFELHLFNLGTARDAETEQARRWAHRLEGGRRTLSQWASTLAASALDVLIYPEIGMDPLTVKLASLRLAPVQAATWGHPETTGLPTIDHYVSAEGLEPPDAATHYSERLVALPNLGVCYEPRSAAAEPPDLAALGLPHDVPLLLCPGAPFKYSPAQDAVWVEISRRARPCRLVFFRPWRGGVNPLLEERLERRFAAAGLRFRDCVTFVPTLAPAHFYGLMERAHLMLDTIGFSGFNTAIQAIECGLPVVTREGNFMRGRLGSGILRRIGMDALVADSDDAYVELAATLTRDPVRRDRLRGEMIARRSDLFGDLAPIRALERFLESAARNRAAT